MRRHTKNTIAEEQLNDLADELRQAVAGEVRFDQKSRLLYSTDASIYQEEPFGVVLPRTLDDLNAIMEICSRRRTPVLARGAGSSLAGQAIGPAIIVDCSRYLNRIVSLDIEAQTVVVEPGVVLNALNRAAGKHGFQFGPDPASAERATLGGSLGNNAAGAHSIRYGMFADHVLEVEAVLSDGAKTRLGQIPDDLARQKAYQSESVEANLYAAALNVREQYSADIKERWPRTWRCASGYTVNYLLPWAASRPPQWTGAYPPVEDKTLNMAALLAGSEGTLAVFRAMTLRLVRVPRQTLLAVLPFADLQQACDAVAAVLEIAPSAVELLPHTVVQTAASLPAYAAQLQVLNRLDKRADLLIVEFSGQDSQELGDRVEKLTKLRIANNILLADSPTDQKQIWGIRKVGLGIMLSRPGDAKPWSFIEDLSVPVENLGVFIREMERIQVTHHVEGEIYGHASAGCLHIRPVLNLKSAEGKQALRSIASQAVELTLDLGGAVSGEHGDGRSRSEWHQRMFGPRVMEAFRLLKAAADPDNLLNPGKIVQPDGSAPPAMDTGLRFGSDYRAQAWQPVMDFSMQSGLENAIEQCNGAGVCRKAEGLMCPSFQATQEEEHSTRGRANLLRAFISGRFNDLEAGAEIVRGALDLCLACKGCKAECPSGVDVARLKYEFIHHYYQKHRRPVRDYLFGYIGDLARLGQPFVALVNAVMGGPLGTFGKRLLGLAVARPLPRLARRERQEDQGNIRIEQGSTADKVLYLPDAFSRYFDPEIEQAALYVLRQAGCQVVQLPVEGAGRTLISKGFLPAARKQAQRVVAAIKQADPEGVLPVVGVEPSEILTLADEYPCLIREAGVGQLALRCFTVEEFLIRPPFLETEASQTSLNTQAVARIERVKSKMRVANISLYSESQKVYIHTHCYQKAKTPHSDGYPSGGEAIISILTAAGYQSVPIEAGCCGMAGAFGYEQEHYAISMQAGELALFPAIRQLQPDTLIAATGTSCREQILNGTGRQAFHPVQLLARQLRNKPVQEVSPL